MELFSTLAFGDEIQSVNDKFFLRFGILGCDSNVTGKIIQLWQPWIKFKPG